MLARGKLIHFQTGRTKSGKRRDADKVTNLSSINNRQQFSRLPIDKPPTNRYNVPHQTSKAMQQQTSCHPLQRQAQTPKQSARQLLSAVQKIGYIAELTQSITNGDNVTSASPRQKRQTGNGKVCSHA